MNKRILLLILSLVVGATMLVSLFACDFGKNGADTEAPTGEVTEGENESGETADESDDPTADTDSGETSGEEDTNDPNAPTCEHPYAATQEGHWKPACDVCGKPEGSIQMHDYAEYQEDEGDLIYYSYVCKVCNFEAYGQEVPYEINLFYPASEISNAVASNGIEGKYQFVSGIGFGSFARPDDEAGANTNITIEDAGTQEDDPVGQYMAIRIRLPRSQNGITITMKSVHADARLSYKINDLKPGWITLAFDLSKFTKTNADGTVTGYIPDNFDEYYLNALILTTYIAPGESLDISYAMFCEEKDDLMSFIENDINCYYFEDVLAKAPVISNPVNCEHDYKYDEEKHTLENPCYTCGAIAVKDEPHTFIEVIGGGRNSYECSICGYAKYLKLVPETVNLYVSASELNAGGIIYYPYTKFNHGLYIETGDAYTRYEGPTSIKKEGTKDEPPIYYNVGQVIFARDDNDVNPDNNGDAENGIRINVGNAHYMVLRVRVNTEGLNPLKVTISTTEFNKTLKDDGVTINTWGTFNFQVPVSHSPKDTWQVYVIDLAKVFPDKYIANADGDYVLDTFYFNICEGNFAPGCTLDLSYMAYCSEWEEVAAIVDEEQLFYMSDANGGGNWTNTETRSCAGECTLGDADIVDNKDGTITYTFKCSVCGNAVTSKTIDNSVERYYYAGEIATTATTYFQINGVSGGKGGSIIYDAASGRVFSRFTGYEKEVDGVMVPQTAQVLWQRAQEDMWADQTAAGVQQYTESVGNAEWLVMRVKTNNPDQKFTLTMSTTEYNAEEGTADGNTYGGMLGIEIPLSSSQEDEWTTYVVNLKDVLGDKYEKDSETGEYVIDSFYFGFSSFAASTHIDIEYVAFVDGSWTELDALVDEQEVVVIADRIGGHGYADVATGKCIEGKHAYGYNSTTDAEGNVINTVACAVCGDVKMTQTVSKDVNKFFDVTKMGCYFGNKQHNDAKFVTGNLDTESGDLYTRFSMTYGNTHVVLSGGSNPNIVTSYTINTGKYAVIKLRSSGNRSIAFDAQTGDKTSHLNTVFPINKELADEWMVWVIDLSVLAGDKNGYTTGVEQTVKLRITTGGGAGTTEGSGIAGGSYLEDPYYLDIAYFAIVDSVDEAKSIIVDDSFTLYENGLNNEGQVITLAKN